jgi:hypothetical protein
MYLLRITPRSQSNQCRVHYNTPHPPLIGLPSPTSLLCHYRYAVVSQDGQKAGLGVAAPQLHWLVVFSNDPASYVPTAGTMRIRFRSVNRL